MICYVSFLLLKQFSFAQFCYNVNSNNALETMFFFKILMFPWQIDSMWIP